MRKTTCTFGGWSTNSISKLNGHVVLDHFSDEYYRGHVHNGHPHGHGTRIYYSGGQYTGDFRAVDAAWTRRFHTSQRR